MGRPDAYVASAGNVVTQASNFGKQSSIYDGIDASVNARLGKGRLVTGGVSTGQTTTDNCQIITDTPQKQFCHQVNPWTGQTQYKASGVYPLPWDLQASAVYQNLPGVPDTGTLSYSNAQIASSLGRNLSGCPAVGMCTATRSIVVLQPFTGFEKRLQQVDARLTRTFRIGRANLKGMVDLYNVFNANTILSVNGTYGSAWLRPTAVLGGRLVKSAGNCSFDFTVCS